MASGARRTGRDKMKLFTTLISCLDYRLDSFPGISRSARFAYAKRLRELQDRGRLYIHHLAFHRPLGIRFLQAIVPGRELARRLLGSERVSHELLESLGVPAPLLVTSLAVMGSQLLVEWAVPPGIDPGLMRDWASSLNGSSWLGWKYPVQSCGDGEPWRRLRALQAVEPLQLRSPLVAYILLAVLDRFRLVPLREAARLTVIAAARDLDGGSSSFELKFRLVRRYYTRMSRAFVLGRYRVFSPQDLQKAHAYIVAEAGCAEDLYAILSAGNAASHMFLGEGVAAAAALADSKTLRGAGGLGGCVIGAWMRLRSFYAPFPYELYDPLEGRWGLQPSGDFTERLARAGLLRERRSV